MKINKNPNYDCANASVHVLFRGQSGNKEVRINSHRSDMPCKKNMPLLPIMSGNDQVIGCCSKKGPIYNIASDLAAHITEWLTIEDMHSISKSSQAGGRLLAKQVKVSKLNDAYLDLMRIMRTDRVYYKFFLIYSSLHNLCNILA